MSLADAGESCRWRHCPSVWVLIQIRTPIDLFFVDTLELRHRVQFEELPVEAVRGHRHDGHISVLVLQKLGGQACAEWGKSETAGHRRSLWSGKNRLCGSRAHWKSEKAPIESVTATEGQNDADRL
jgi:hypothetical protein